MSQHCHLLERVTLFTFRWSCPRPAALRSSRKREKTKSFCSLPSIEAQRLLMVRTACPQMSGHGLVQGSSGMTRVCVAVVRAAANKACVAQVGTLRGGAQAGSRSRSPVGDRSGSPRRPVACTWGNTQVRRASLLTTGVDRAHVAREVVGAHL